MINKKKQSGVQQDDFKQGSLLHQVAQKDTALAYKLAEQYGGSKIYISPPDTLKRAARNRLIMKRASVCEGHRFIANDLGLTGGHLRRLIVKNIDAYCANNPLHDEPD